MAKQLHVHDIVAFDDNQLDRYLIECSRFVVLPPVHRAPAPAVALALVSRQA